MVRRGRWHDRTRLPFWLHQGLEYVFAVLVAGLGLHLGGLTEATLVAAGTLLLLGSLATRGPLGAFRLLSPAAHRLLDWVVVVGLVAVPLVRLPRLDVLGAALLWLVAASLAQLVRATRYATPGARATAVAGAANCGAAVATAGRHVPGVTALGAAAVPVGVADAPDEPHADTAAAGIPGTGLPAAETAVAGASAAGCPAPGGLLPSLARLAGRTLGASARRGRPG